MASATTADATTIEMAIRNGIPDEVEVLLGRMSDAEATDCLTSTYGQGRDSPDDDDLYHGTTPVIHAARSGKPDIFLSIIRAMRARLDLQLVKDLLEIKDCRGRSVLAMAARGGNKDVFEQALKVLEEVLTDTQVEAMLIRRDSTGRSLVADAVLCGDKATFETVLKAARERLGPEPVATMLTLRDLGGRSLAAVAALSGDKATFEAVLKALRVELEEEQIKGILKAQDNTHSSLLTFAVGCMNVLVFNAAMAFLKDYLSSQEVATMLTLRDLGGRSLAAVAALSGDKATFEAVLKALRVELEEEQIKGILKAQDNTHSSLLTFAVGCMNVLVFNAAMAYLKDYLSSQEVATMLTLRDLGGRTLAAVAALSGDKDIFEAVLKALRVELEEEQIKGILKARDNTHSSLLTFAVGCMNALVFNAAMAYLKDYLSSQEVATMLTLRDLGGRSLAAVAALSGDKATFEVVLNVLRVELEEEQIKGILKAKDNTHSSLLTFAVGCMNALVFNAAMAYLKDYLSSQEVATMLTLRDLGGRSLAAVAALSGDKATFEVVLNVLRVELEEEQVCGQLTSSGMNVLKVVIEKYCASCCHIVLQIIEKFAVDRKVARALDDAFPKWHEVYEKGGNKAVNESEAIFVGLLNHSAYPTSDFLHGLAHDNQDGWQRFVKLVLKAMESAKNPLIPGMNLSVALGDAAERAREGGERRLSDLRQNVDEYMKEILERLPQTVRGFKNGVRGCSRLFEPEGPRENPVARPGPLRLAFDRRQQMEGLCDVPLVMDYMSNKFTCGLPDLKDTKGVLRNEEEMKLLDDSINPRMGSVDLGEKHLWWLQGIALNEDPPVLTLLQGAQFITAGLLIRLRSYYRVPAMRMAMDFVVYLVMLVAYCDWVLLHEDGPMTLGEGLFAFYVLAGIYNEYEELKRDFHAYLRDIWNVLDVLGFVMLFGGLLVRLVVSESPWGRGMFALSAPLVFSRVLFFVQIHKFQGPMIQAMFSMAMVLLKFGLILFVIMLGFTLSFWALFRDMDSFGETVLHLFMTMLGDVTLFDELDDSSRERYAVIGRLLLVLFIVVVTIMLLNLLIAILSTAHAYIHSNAEREFKMSKARIVQHYRLVVELDILPPPFNVLQLFVTLLFFATRRQKSILCRRHKRTLGHVIFWVTLGPIALGAGTVLWVASIPKIISILPNFLRQITTNGNRRFLFLNLALFLVHHVVFVMQLLENGGREVEVVGFFLIHLVLFSHGPITLIIMWLMVPYRWITLKEPLSNTDRLADMDVQNMLKDAGVSASELRKYVENPMVDPDVQRGEINRGTTVQHMKFLRDHLEEATNDRIDKLHETVVALSASTESRVSELRNEMNEKFGRVIKMLEAKHNSVASEEKE